MMKKIKPITVLIFTMCVLAAAAVICEILFRKNPSAAGLQILSITFLTCFYHFSMRVAVGEAVTVFCRNRSLNADSFWFRPKKFEKKLYRLLRVKKWKKKMITAKPEQFDIKIRTPQELFFYMMQAEIAHELMMLLSFVPLLLIIFYGEAVVFILTSAAACLIDAVFVMIQRYNRPRVQKWIMNQKN